MSLASLLTQTVEVLHRSDGAEDDYGNPVAEWSDGVSYPGRLEQRSGSELTVDRDTQVADWVLFLPPDAVISGDDRVTWDDMTFEVIGPPVVARAPRGPHHVEAALRRTS